MIPGSGIMVHLRYIQHIITAGSKAAAQFDIYLTVERGTIKSACIRGDFFGSRDIAGLEQLICGCELRRQSLAAVLENIDIQQYISGCSLKDFASLICP